MKLKLLSIFLIGLFATSCIKDEPQWKEADIVEFTLPDSVMASRIISQENNKISIVLKPGVNYKKLIPLIKLCEGASVYPSSEDTLDLTNDVIYTVTSQDGLTKRKYTVTTTEIALKFDFDKWTNIETAKTKYPKYTDDFWDNANSAFSMVLSAEDASFANDTSRYATRPTIDAVKGKACLLETNKGGKVVTQFVPLVAGSAFMGKFSLNISNPVRSAKFGQILPAEYGKPERFTGYYKYKSGETFQYWNKATKKESFDETGKKDKCSIYAIIFKVKKGKLGINEFLDGTNVQTDARVVAKATIADGSATDFNKFSYFDVPFLNVKTNLPEFDLNYEENDYKIAIVLSSSQDGDNYQGSVGSTLIVDELEIKIPIKKD